MTIVIWKQIYLFESRFTSGFALRRPCIMGIIWFYVYALRIPPHSHNRLIINQKKKSATQSVGNLIHGVVGTKKEDYNITINIVPWLVLSVYFDQYQWLLERQMLSPTVISRAHAQHG